MQKFLCDIRPVELVGFPPAQRWWLEHRAFEMLRKDHRFAEWMPLGLCLAGTIAGYWAIVTIGGGLGFGVVDFNVSLICSLIGGPAGAFVGGWLGRQWLLYKLRPYLRRIT